MQQGRLHKCYYTKKLSQNLCATPVWTESLSRATTDFEIVSKLCLQPEVFCSVIALANRFRKLRVAKQPQYRFFLKLATKIAIAAIPGGCIRLFASES
jgi:hypothetical protein